MITQADIENWFIYHSPRLGQNDRYQEIRLAARRLAEVIVANSAPSADQGIACETELESQMFRAGARNIP